MDADIETIVVGAGAVGLAIARALSIAGHQVLVLEQHDIIGSETSSRNSEVIHAGIYYPPGSLRAKLCVEGKHEMYRFCERHGVPHARCTKLLVATADDQLAKLEGIHRTAIANGVEDMQPLTPAQARALEPEVSCVAAMLSPSTGIVDSHAFMLALEGEAQSHGAQVVLQSLVRAAHRQADNLFRLDIEADGDIAPITCRNLVLSPGLHATRLARTLAFDGGYGPPETYYAVGQYYALSGRSPFSRHIYPMPQGAWLGLHATIDIGGRCKFGPDIAFHDAETHGIEGLVMLFGIESPGLTASLAIGRHVQEMLRR
jgi:L-2-hydroxyglutarate oxidase LhgO